MKPNVIKRIALACGLCATALWGAACSDDPVPADAGGLDATVMNPDAPPGRPDAPAPDAEPGPVDADVDAGPGSMDAMPGDTGGQPGRLFSDFVKDLINNHTNGTESPVALPPEGSLIDNQDQAEYEDLFP